MITVAFHAGQLLQPVPGGIGRYELAMLDHLADSASSRSRSRRAPRPPSVAPARAVDRPRPAARQPALRAVAPAPAPAGAHRRRRRARAEPRDPAGAAARSSSPCTTSRSCACPTRRPRRGVQFHTRGLELARRHATLVIVPSAFTAPRARTRRVRARPDRRSCPFGIDAPVAARPRRARRARSRAAGVRPPFVLTVGTVEPRKDLPDDRPRGRTAARRPSPARRSSSSARGAGARSPSSTARSCACSARSRGASSTRSYRRADAFCVASLYEGFGLPALEAMARGHRDGRRRPARRWRSSCAAPDCCSRRATSTACADALARVLDDEQLRAELRSSGRARAGRAHLGALGRGPRRAPTRARSRSVVRRLRRVRVALDVSAVPARPVGAGVYTIALARGLAARDDIELHLRRPPRRRPLGRARRPAPSVHAVAPARRPARLAWEQLGAPAARAAARRRRLARSALHAAARARRVPTVVTVHDLTFFDHPEWHERSKVVYFRRMIRAAGARADVVVCVSDFTDGAPARPLHTARRGRRRSARRRPRALRARPRGGAGDHGAARARTASRRRTSRSAGRSNPARTCRRSSTRSRGSRREHPDLRLVLAGGDGWGVDEVRAAIASSGVATRVLRPGYLDDDALVALFRRAAAVVVPVARGGLRLARARGARVRHAARHDARLGHRGGRRRRRAPGRRPTTSTALGAALGRVLDDHALAAELAPGRYRARRGLHVGTLGRRPRRRVPARAASSAGPRVRAFVTGATGFVGPHLCAHLRACGDDVVVRRRRARRLRHHRPRRGRTASLERGAPGGRVPPRGARRRRGVVARARPSACA